MIKPGRRIACRQNGSLPEYSNVRLFAADMLDLEVARGDVGDELGLVVTFQRICEDEIIGHDATEYFAVGAHQGFHPIIIQLAHMLLNFDGLLGRGSFHSRYSVRKKGLKASTPIESPSQPG